MSSVTIDAAVCKGCGLCISVCPAGVLLPGTRRNAMGYLVPDAPDAGCTRCTGCLTCEYICPDMAITIDKAKGAVKCATK